MSLSLQKVCQFVQYFYALSTVVDAEKHRVYKMWPLHHVLLLPFGPHCLKIASNTALRFEN